ncbi:histone H3.v1-like [Boleophthalmus pectinirostris]|uniref:histone H3.v1-like n=1 Tax=Boleophthalmus pectinirostris TaxID=150288 RepID=UPI002431E2B3|nr:histone H3.v1-like [Boleophthalmus pectinirostris]
MDSQKNLWQRLETICEDEEFSGPEISEDAEQEAEIEELQESSDLEEEAEQILDQVEEEREEEEEEKEEEKEEVQTPPSVRISSSYQKRSLSSLSRSKSRVYDFQPDVSPPKVRRKRRSTKVKFKDLFPDWVVQLMFSIEEATHHELVVE